jgi:hypothetical protein
VGKPIPVYLPQYYENDDPIYFRSKIQYTLKIDVTDEELFYTDTADDVRESPIYLS